MKAQTFYSTDPNFLKAKTESNNLLSSYRAYYPDSTMENFHNFFPRNFLGNVGLSSPDYFLKYGTENLGFRFFQPPIGNDKFNEQEVVYQRSKGPYADLTGIAGSKLLQIFKLNYTQTFRQRLNVTLKLNRYNSTGYYQNQQSFANNIYLSSNYNTKSGNFGYYFYILNNQNKNKENGGIQNGTLNDSTALINKGLLAVNIDSAARENRENKIMFNPWFKLNTSKDSLSTANQYIQIKSFYASNKYRYRDQGVESDGFYNTFYFDSVYTDDSSHVKKFSNEVDYTFLLKDHFGFSTGFRSEYNDVWQEKDSIFYNQVLTSSLFFRKKMISEDSLDRRSREFETKFDFQYVVNGPNTGNIKIETQNTFFANRLKNRLFYFSLLFEDRSADYIYNNWTSNHFIWTNNFTSQTQIQSKLGGEFSKHFSAFAFYQVIQNLLYFDSASNPQQYKPGINNLALNINYHNLFFKHLGFSLNYTYQNTSKTEYIRLPSNSATIKLYYYANLFRGNMQVQLGSQLQFYQSFSAYAFMPATQIYQLQDNSSTGNFPYVDAYLNLRIRPASFFVKVENLLAGYAGTSYALVPGYYQPQMAFRFGISWLFFD